MTRTGCTPLLNSVFNFLLSFVLTLIRKGARPIPLSMGSNNSDQRVLSESFQAVRALNQATKNWHSEADSGISASASFPNWSCFHCAVFSCCHPYRSPASSDAGAIASGSLWPPVEPAHSAVAAPRLLAHPHGRLLVLFPLQRLPQCDRLAQRRPALDDTHASST
jgi:hypothetical protein